MNGSCNMTWQENRVVGSVQSRTLFCCLCLAISHDLFATLVYYFHVMSFPYLQNNVLFILPIK